MAGLTYQDLKPYQTYFVFRASAPLSRAMLTALGEELAAILNKDVAEADDRCHVRKLLATEQFDRDFVAIYTYRRTPRVRWASGPDAPRDTEHHLALLLSHQHTLLVIPTDAVLPAKLARATTEPSFAAWSGVKLASPARLINGFVYRAAKTLWLSGIHRSVAVKPDSKVLIGQDLEASLDALGDQSYQFTSTRCEGPDSGTIAAASIGVTPRTGKVWLGGAPNWRVVLQNAQAIAATAEAANEKPRDPYPVLAKTQASLTRVSGAFEVSLPPPEYVEDEQLRAALQTISDGTVSWTVTPSAGANARINIPFDGKNYPITITLTEVAGDVTHAVAGDDTAPEPIKAVTDLLRRNSLLKIYYDSMHTYSDGQLFEVRTRPLPFTLTPKNFPGVDITLEKPTRASGHGVDLGRIGAAGEKSLFTWVWSQFRTGWLWCDDEAGELADFIHLDRNHQQLTFIHVKAADSSSPTRGLAVAPYEVVSAQALKNLRYMERAELERPLQEKLTRDRTANIKRGWRNGKELPPKSTELWKTIAKIPYSQFTRRVVVLQPHVRASRVPKDLTANTADARRARLLVTLLHAVKADINRYGVELEVWVDR